MLNAPPVPIAATYDPGTRDVDVEFDLTLTPGLSDPANWSIIVGVQRRIPIGLVTAAGNHVVWTATAFGGAAPAGNVVEYLATPPDITGLTGDPVAPFSHPYV